MDSINHTRPGASLVMRETLSNPEWSRLPKAGQRLSGFARSTLYELMARGKIRSRRVGKLRFVHVPSITALIENGEVLPSAAAFTTTA